MSKSYRSGKAEELSLAYQPDIQDLVDVNSVDRSSVAQAPLERQKTYINRGELMKTMKFP